MAEFVNPLGKIRGKFGNVITYGDQTGKIIAGGQASRVNRARSRKNDSPRLSGR